MVSETSKGFLAISSHEIDAKINETLEKLGKFVKADRSYVFRFDDAEHTIISCTNEWCAEGISTTIEEMQNVTVTVEPLWVEHLKTYKPIIITSIESLPPESKVMKALLESHNVKAFLAVPMILKGEIKGIFGFDSGVPRDWDENDISLIQTIAEIFLYVLNRRQAEIDYQNLFFNMIDAFAYHKIITDENGEPIDYVYLDVNPSFTRLTGLRREDVIGKRATEVIPSLDFDLIKKFGETAIYGKNIVFEDDMGFPKRYFLINAYRQMDGYFVTSFSDITDRKKAEEKLYESEEMYRTFVENSNLAIFKVTLDGKINYVNDYFVKILGYESEEQILHTSAFDHIHPDSVETVQKAWQKKVNEEEIHAQKIRVIKKNGDLLEIELKAALLFDAEKRPISFFCIAWQK